MNLRFMIWANLYNDQFFKQIGNLNLLKKSLKPKLNSLYICLKSNQIRLEYQLINKDPLKTGFFETLLLYFVTVCLK